MASIASGTSILVVANDLALAKTLVGLITSSDVVANSSTTTIPWRISNKYYDADVSFSLEVLSGSASDAVEDVVLDPLDALPAVIYAFSPGSAESMSPSFTRFVESRKASTEDAEVCLAVCVPPDSTTATSIVPVPKPQDEEVSEELFIKHGFEYVNLLAEPVPSDDEFDRDVPGIMRIRDALQSIMWPSMVRKKPTAPNKSKFRTTMPVIFKDDAADGEEGISLNVDEISESIANSLFSSLGGRGTGIDDRELASLEAWLEDDAELAWGRPGKGVVEEAVTESVPPPSAGFDDDFSEFVSSAPIISQPSTSAQPPSSTALQTAFEDQDSLLPLHSDILAASNRLFSPSSTSASTSQPPNPSFDPNADGPEEPEPFDLNQVLGVLQAMREEISLIDDMGKRREAAAAAALGLVKGLGFDDDGDGDEGEDDSDIVFIHMIRLNGLTPNLSDRRPAPMQLGMSSQG